MRSVIAVALMLVMTGSALANDERFWCLDAASGGYIMDPRRPVGLDKSKPQAFIPDRLALRLSGETAYINYQGLGEKQFICVTVKDQIIRCIGELDFFVFDRSSGKFNLARLSGHVVVSIHLCFDLESANPW
jgi:hypothetical protein